MAHRRAVALMVLCTVVWSIAGVVTRQLDAARSFEVTFWRSLFNVMALLLALLMNQKLRGVGKDLGEGIQGFKEGLKGKDDDKPSQLGNERRETPQDEASRQDSQRKDS